MSSMDFIYYRIFEMYIYKMSAPIAKHDLAFAFVRWGQVLDLGFAFDFEAVLYI